jgi:hypothetical protein
MGLNGPIHQYIESQYSIKLPGTVKYSRTGHWWKKGQKKKKAGKTTL